ncbi:PREDICTED: monoglyceride lipase-like [Branchiostoma belcheri]|uniref:Monoglyceride lipase-like n=1 Tax=Branchiostoma belcheri TaxID=7741 RepID=A0A6P4YMN5_BRABE|nr:PREDICTED: monoglyceride lipase-like [Branchiostoma belcheri]
MSGDSGTSVDGPKTPQGVFYSRVPHLVNSSGQYLYCKYWEPQGQAPRALLMIVHGVAEHCQRYEEIATELNKEGILVFAHDHVGHGQSQGYPADIKSFHEYVQDVLQHADKMRGAHPGIPIFILGHSMGGTVATLAAMERPTMFAGVVLTAPAIIPAPETATRWRVLAARTLASILPRFEVGTVDTSFVSRDPEMVKAYEEDPLIYHGGLRARWAVQTLDAMDQIRRQAASFQPPFLALHGDQDKLSLPEGAQFLYDNAPEGDKQIKIYPGLYHELLRELKPDAEMVRRDIVTWVTERIDNTATS